MATINLTNALINEDDATIKTIMGFAEGSYTPTATAVTNVDAVTASSCEYLKVGNHVTVSGNINIDATTASVVTEVRITLPISSNFSSTLQAGGTMNSGGNGSSGGIFADVTNDQLLLQCIPLSATNTAYRFIAMYKVI